MSIKPGQDEGMTTRPEGDMLREPVALKHKIHLQRV